MPTQAERLLSSVQTLLKVLLVSERRFPTAEGRVRYNPLDFQTLHVIEMSPGAHGAEIARTNEVTPTTQQSVLDRLGRRGLIEKEKLGGTRIGYRLTPEGQELRAAIQRQDLRNMKVMLDVLTPAERRIFLPALERIASHLSAGDDEGDAV